MDERININLDFDRSIYLAWKCFAEKNNIIVKNDHNLDDNNSIVKEILEFIGNE